MSYKPMDFFEPGSELYNIKLSIDETERDYERYRRLYIVDASLERCEMYARRMKTVRESIRQLKVEFGTTVTKVLTERYKNIDVRKV